MKKQVFCTKDKRYEIEIEQGQLYVFEWYINSVTHERQLLQKKQYYYGGEELTLSLPVKERERLAEEYVFKKLQLRELKYIYRDMERELGNGYKGKVPPTSKEKETKLLERLRKQRLETALKKIQFIFRGISAKDYRQFLQNGGNPDLYLEELRKKSYLM